MINLDEYPKSKEKLYKFCEEWLLALQEMLLKNIDTKEIKEIVKPPLEPELIEMQALNILNNNRRVLYDFFDKEGIKLGMTVGEEFIWHIPIEFPTTLIAEKGEKNRIEAEEKGFIECFKLLENGKV